jgi:hypothetical protein
VGHGARAEIKGMKLDTDFQNVIFQDVVAVSNAQAVSLAVTDPKGDVTVKLDRGAAAWDHRFATWTFRFLNPPHVRDWVKTGFRVVVQD